MLTYNFSIVVKEKKMVALRMPRAEIVDLGEVERLIKLYDGMLRGVQIGKGGRICAAVVNNDYLIIPI